MGISQAAAEDHALPGMGFGGECQQAARDQHALGFAQQRRKVTEIDHRIRSQNQIRAGVRFAAQGLQHFPRFHFRVEPAGARPLDHPR